MADDNWGRFYYFWHITSQILEEIGEIKKKKRINKYEKKERKPCVDHTWGQKSFGSRRVCDKCGKVETF